jgi:hypothetical protein
VSASLAGLRRRECGGHLPAEPQLGEFTMFRTLQLASVAVALAAFTAALARADHEGKEAEGHVIKVADGKITVAGKDKKEHTHEVAKDAAITLDGKKAKLEDLKPHMHVKVTMNEKHTITKLDAHTHEKK